MNFGNPVLAGGRVLVGQHAHRLAGVHGRVPGHVGHEQEQDLDRVGVAAPGVADHRLQHAVDRQRRVPAERLVDPDRRAVGIEQQILRPARKAQRRARQRLAGLDLVRPAERARSRRAGAGIGRFVAPAAGHIDAADQQLQHVQRPAGLEAVGVGRDAAHRVHRHRPAEEAGMLLAACVGPRLLDEHRPLERDMPDLGGDPADRRGRDAAALGHGLRRVGRVAIALGQMREHRHRAPAIRQASALPPSCGLRRGLGRQHGAGRRIEDERMALLVARKQAVRVGARGVDHQPAGVGQARQIVEVDAARGAAARGSGP